MNKIIIDIGIRENKVALVENDELVELHIEQWNDERIMGNIYKGKVVNVLPGMQAAFVDIGLDKNAFLYVKDAIPEKDSHLKDLNIKDVLKSGQDIVVQVIKESIGTKGPRVTTNINLPGKHLVLMPTTDYIGISRKITDDKNRERLKELAKKYKPEGMGVILRTSSEDIEEEEFKRDIELLIRILEDINTQKTLGIGTKLIYKDLNLVQKTVRDYVGNSTDKIIVNNRKEHQNISELVNMISPNSKTSIECIDDIHDIFAYFKLDSQIKLALDKKVPLKNGGYLVIDETEALTSIDINTGKYTGNIDLRETILSTNIEAAIEIAKQIRLRNIGGIIIIDFIDMKNKSDEKKVINELRKSLKKDTIKTKVLGITQLGLVEMTRRKEEKSLSEKLLKKCECCDGMGSIFSNEFILSKIENEVKRAKYHTNAESIIFRVSSWTIEYIKEKAKNYTDDIKKMYNINVFFIEDANSQFNDVKVFKLGSEKFIKNIIDMDIKN